MKPAIHMRFRVYYVASTSNIKKLKGDTSQLNKLIKTTKKYVISSHTTHQIYVTRVRKFSRVLMPFLLFPLLVSKEQIFSAKFTLYYCGEAKFNRVNDQ